MKQADAERLVGEVVSARVKGSSYLAVLETIEPRRAWRAIVRILALERVAAEPGALVPANSRLSVYGGDVVEYGGTVPEYYVSVEDACFAEIVALRDAPVPPTLESALDADGLEGDQIAVWWDASAKGVRSCDGRVVTDCSLLGWVSFVQHERISPFLQPFALGQTGAPASHSLLLDRRERSLAVAPTGVARLYLRNRMGEPVTAPARLDGAFLLDVVRFCPELATSELSEANDRLRLEVNRATELQQWLGR